jgi:hypothetical protein
MKSSRTIRVLHIPYNTPYVRKLSSPIFEVVNCKASIDGSTVPEYASLAWLARQAKLDFFDLVHIHFFEAEPLDTIRCALQRCAEHRKAIVFTAHDLCPVFSRHDPGFENKLVETCSYSQAVVTLTPQAAESLNRNWGVTSTKATVIPHGYVLHPEHQLARSARSHAGLVEFTMFGSFRPNRASYLALVDWFYGTARLGVRMNLLLRPLGPADPQAESTEARSVLSFIRQREERINAVMLPNPNDDVLASFLAQSDVIVMPYVWGTHSGQLELAFDLGLIPVITNVGFYRSQWECARGHVEEPIWVDWADGARHLYASRLIEGLSAASNRVVGRTTRSTAESFREHRLSEHQSILDAHRRVYSSSIETARTLG